MSVLFLPIRKISQYLHVLPVICDGGLSRCALLSLAMFWNQLNYITAVQVHDLIDLFLNALGFLRVLGTTAPLWIERVGS